MVARLATFVKQETNTNGTGTIELEPAVNNRTTFSNYLNDGDETLYAIYDDPTNPVKYEIGRGTFNSGAPSTVSRDSVYLSSNGGSKISLDAAVTYTVIGTIAPQADGKLSGEFIGPFSAGAASAPSIASAGDTNTGIFWPSANTLGIATGGSQQVTVGINGIIAQNRIRINGTDFPKISIKNTDANYEWLWDVDDSGTFNLRTSGGSRPMAFNKNSPGNSIYVATSGNVGIGTSTPSHRLDVNGQGRFANDLIVGGLLKGNESNDYIHIDTASDSIRFATNGVEHLNITSDGAFSGKERFLFSNDVTIADDSTTALSTPRTACFVLVTVDGEAAESFPKSAAYAIAYVDVGGSPAYTVVTTGTNVEFTTGALSGTTGSDNHLTISPQDNGTIQLENRLGDQVKVQLAFL